MSSSDEKPSRFQRLRSFAGHVREEGAKGYSNPRKTLKGRSYGTSSFSKGGGSLWQRVKRSAHERSEVRKIEKEEKNKVEKEAKSEARKEYMETFRTKKTENLKAQARARAEHDAASRGGSLDAVGGFAKGAMMGLGKAGKNFLESEQFALPKTVPDFGFGGAFTPDKKSKGKKRKNKAQDILDSLI